MSNREFVQLAHVYDVAKNVVGWYDSEKLNGIRCFWDGGVSRGYKKADVPWANTAKDSRYVLEQVATGLWSRYGNVIHAPDEWLDHLPNFQIDGELYIHGYLQELNSAVRNMDKDMSKWKKAKLYAFDIPPYKTIFGNGVINNPHFSKTIQWNKCSIFLEQSRDIMRALTFDLSPDTQFISIVPYLEKNCVGNAIYHPQYKIKSFDEVEKRLEESEEGRMLRYPFATYSCTRSHNVLKLKHLDTDEATVVGCTSGRETDRGSKLLGLMGALIVEWRGKRFELSGFTDLERSFETAAMRTHAIANPGKEMPSYVRPQRFPVGSKVKFAFRGITKDGVPVEARFKRK